MKWKVSKIFFIAFALSFTFVTIPCRNPSTAQELKPDPKSGSPEKRGLREVFIEEWGAGSEWDSVVGRLGIFLLRQGGFEQVRLDHEFRKGDAFRFELTSNRDGWFYVLHSSPGGKVKELWPGKTAQKTKQPSNKVYARQTYLIPPTGVFRFDEEIGKELFYVAIRSEDTPPSFSVFADQSTDAQKSDAKGPAVPPQKATTRIDNFTIKDPFGIPERGVVFDPGTKDGDAYVYFSSLPEDTKTAAMIQFTLRHVE